MARLDKAQPVSAFMTSYRPITVRHGSATMAFQIPPGFCVVDLVFNDYATKVLGFSPFNVRVLRNGVSLDCLEELIPGDTVVVETAANIKEGLPGPKRHRCESYRLKHGFGIEPSKGDHVMWNVAGSKVSVNYCNGELDMHSLKALARVLRVSPFALLQAIRNAQ